MKKKKRKTKSIADHPDVQRMYALSVEYCDLLEKGTRSKRYLLRHLGDLLPQLFAAAMALPYAPCSRRIQRELSHCSTYLAGREQSPSIQRIAKSSSYLDTVVSTKPFFRVMARIRNILGEYDKYRHTFDPYRDRDVMSSTLSNDLAEIWQNVSHARLLFKLDEDTAKKHAIWSWSFDVRQHWGSCHYCDAMKAIFFAMSDIGDDDWRYRTLTAKRLPRGQYRRTKRRKRV